MSFKGIVLTVVTQHLFSWMTEGHFVDVELRPDTFIFSVHLPAITEAHIGQS